MTTASKKMIQAIEYVVKPISVGTNIALFNLLWAMVSGAFLPSRGAVHTALALCGRSEAEIRRGSEALRNGQWTIEELIKRWREWVLSQGKWEVQRYEGWRAVSCDVVVYPRLKLKGLKGKFYRGTFGRAVKALGFGVIVDVGHYGDDRVALLNHIVRCENKEGSSGLLQRRLLEETNKRLGEDGVAVHDAGTSVKEMRAVKMKRYVIRLPKNCVVRRNELPPNAHGNRKYGERIRPVRRKRKGKEIAATTGADVERSFEVDGRTIPVHGWLNVVLDTDKVADDAPPFNLWVFLTRCSKSHSFWQRTSPQRTHQPRQFASCILIGGRLSNSLWPPNRWLDSIANLYSTSRPVFGYLSCRYLQEICSPMSPSCCLPSLPDTGITPRRRHPAGCVGSWHEMDCPKFTLFTPEFAQKRRKPTIYRRESRLIAEKRLQLSGN